MSDEFYHRNEYYDESEIGLYRVYIDEKRDLCRYFIKTQSRVRVIEQIKVVRDIIDKVIIGERSGVQVCAHLPVRIISTEKEEYEPKGRNSQDENKLPGSDSQLESEPTFSGDKVIPFQFTVKMPPPRYYPLILERDNKGRIVNSKFPDLTL